MGRIIDIEQYLRQKWAQSILDMAAEADEQIKQLLVLGIPDNTNDEEKQQWQQ